MMGKLQNDQKGFSAVELVLVLVIVALIGVVGWLVYKDHHKNTTTPVETSYQSPAKPSVYPGAATTKTTTSPSGNNSALPTYSYTSDCSNVVAFSGTTSIFTSKNEPSLSFEFPSSWKVTNKGNQYNPGDSCEFTSPDGAVNLLWSSTVEGLGGSCVSPAPQNLQVTINSSSPIQEASGFSVINFSYSGYVGVAVVATSSDFTKIGPTNTCSNVFYPLFKSLDSSYNMDLQAVMKSNVSNQDLQSVTSILESLKY